MTRIVFHIDELVLRGFNAADGPTIGDVLSAEIERRLREQGAPESWRRGAVLDRLFAADVNIPAAAPQAGAAIGAAVHRSLLGGGKEGGK